MRNVRIAAIAARRPSASQLVATAVSRTSASKLESKTCDQPAGVMWLEWTDGRISFIRDYKYVRYVIDDAELILAPDAAPLTHC